MVLESAVKRVLSILITSAIALVLGTFLLVPIINKIYWKVMDLSPGPDAESELLKFLILFQWPAFLIIGGILGNWLYIKYLTKASNGQTKAS